MAIAAGALGAVSLSVAMARGGQRATSCDTVRTHDKDSN